MQEPATSTPPAPRPVAVFRSALVDVAAKERAVRARRPDRVQAIAGLADDDLAQLAEAFDALMRGPADASAMAASLHAALRSLSPDVPADELDNDEVDNA